MLFAVSQHSEVEANIVKELRSQDLLASPQAAAPRPIQWDDIPQLVYLTATIKARFSYLCMHAFVSETCIAIPP